MSHKCVACGQEVKKVRTDKQNRAFFGIAVQKLADHYGTEKEIMYKALAGAYYGFEEVVIGQLTIRVPKSTRNRTTKEANEFYEWIQKLGAEAGVNIPSPNEQLQEA